MEHTNFVSMSLLLVQQNIILSVYIMAVVGHVPGLGLARAMTRVVIG